MRRARTTLFVCCLLVIMMIISLVLLGCIQFRLRHCALLLITGFVIISQMTQLAVDVCADLKL